MKILIADDEPLARRRLKRLLDEVTQPPVEYVDASNGFEALTVCINQAPDIALLDIRMPVMDGLQAAMEINKAGLNTAIIFVTAYDEHALAAFENNAIDYLLKPIKQERLQQAIRKAQHYIASPALISQAITSLSGPRSHLCCSFQGTSTLINVRDIICFKADQKYVSAHTATASFLLEESLKVLEDEFKQVFIRVHRNALINIKHISQLKKNADGQQELFLKGLDEPVIISRRHLAGFRKRLQQIH